MVKGAGRGRAIGGGCIALHCLCVDMTNDIEDEEDWTSLEPFTYTTLQQPHIQYNPERPAPIRLILPTPFSSSPALSTWFSWSDLFSLLAPSLPGFLQEMDLKHT